MKKRILTVLAALLVAVPAVQAQKVNKDALLSKIEKSDADIADAKKGAKAATWINRGKAFYEAAVAPTKDIFQGMELPLVEMTLGKPQSVGTGVIANEELQTLVYPYFTLYIKDGRVFTWDQTQFVVENGFAKALEAYNHAFEVDAKSASKVKDQLMQLINYCKQAGNVYKDLFKFGMAGDAYMLADKALLSPAYAITEAEMKDVNDILFFAGYMFTLDAEFSKSADSSKKGAECFQRALDNGFMDEKGDIYFYLFHCYYNLREVDHDYVFKGKEVLEMGIEKFPQNEEILNGLMQLYTAEKGVGDPKDLVARIEKAIENNPTNIDLWMGRGRIFFALNDLDMSIESFHKAVELDPKNSDALYLLGLFYTLKGDELNKIANDKTYSSQAEMEADEKVIADTYMAAIPYLETAHELNPTHEMTLFYLKQLCFRLRDEQAGMMDKYTKYNELYNAVKTE